MQKYIFSLVFLFTLSACQINSDVSLSAGIPDVVVQCFSGDSNACTSANANKKFWIGYSNNTAYDCETEMQNFTINRFGENFDAHQSVESTWDGSKLGAEVTTWVNENETPVGSLTSSSFRLCAFVDLNDNQRLDSGEPFSQKDGTTSQASVILEYYQDL